MSEKTHWKKWNNPDYLGAYAFQPGEEKTVTIKEVKREIVKNERGSEECTVAHFAEDVKPLILNVTNCKMISKLIGSPFVEDWPGKKISLKVKKISAFGDMVDAVRVSNQRPTEEVLICESCGNTILPAAGKTAKQIADATKIKYKKQLCMICAKKEVTHG